MSVDILDRVYDAYTGEMGQQFMRETQRRIHWMCSSAHGASVLDVGCSQGLVSILLGREGKSVLGVDTSPAAIRAADERLVREHVNVRKCVSFVEGDFAAQSFDGVTFDCIVMGEVLEHLIEPKRFVERAAQLLPPCGRLVVTVPFGINDHIDHKHTFYLLEPLRLIAEHFELVELTILGKWLGIVAARRAEPVAEPMKVWPEEQIAALERAFNRIERDLVDELSSIRGKLDDANTKYRSSNEELARLKREAAHYESERKSAERARTQLEQQVSQLTVSNPANDPELRKELNERKAAFENQREQAHARELNVVRLEERLAHAGQLRALELAARDSELALVRQEHDQVSDRLRDREASLMGVNERARLASDRYEQELRRLQGELDSSTEKARFNAEQSANLQTLISQMAEQVEASQQALSVKAQEAGVLAEKMHSLHETARLARVEATDLRCRLADANEVEKRNLTLQRELAQTRESLRQLEASARLREAAAAEREREFSQRQLNEASRTQAVQLDTLERNAEKQRSAVRDLEQQVTQTREQVTKANQAERRAASQLEQERRNRAAAERKIVQTRNTLSFRLGYELIHGFKSRERLRSLPSALWALQKEAVQRRSARALHEVPLVATFPRVAESSAVAPSRFPPTAPASADTAVATSSSASRRSHNAQGSATRPPQEPNAAVPARRSVPQLGAGIAELRVACIHDEFTFASYEPECKLLQLTPSGFREELEAFDPELLFVESAWRGKGDLWGKKISHRGHELLELVECCRARGVPTVFWNKEDPVHFGTFVNTAKLFDYVFTTDIDCIGRYQRALGHERVYLLPFACQPASHNPIEKYERKDAICFAGAYYVRYPERQQDLASFAHNFTDAPRLEIFDRNLGKNDPNYAFPEEYRPFIVGTLAFDEIDRAYKGYRYALNLNSIKESQTMFARRLFELLGSNTVTVSNFSRGVRLMFGDLVITTDRGERARDILSNLIADENRMRRLRLAGLRKVMREHTYGERLRFIASRVWEREVPDDLPVITVLGLANDEHAARLLLSSFERQRYWNKVLVLVTPVGVELPQSLPSNARHVSLEESANSTIAGVAQAGSYVATFSTDDHYGPSYLLDLALATRYTKAAAIGKSARYVSGGAGAVPALTQDESQYRRSGALQARAAIIRRDVVATRSLGDWLTSLAGRVALTDDGLAIDEFNYCEGGATLPSQLLATIDDLEGTDEGLTLEELLKRGPGRAPAPRRPVTPQQAISGERLGALFKPAPGKPILISLENGELLVESGLPDETHEYIYANQMWRLAELGLPHSERFHLEASPGLNLHMTILFLDENKQRLAHKLCPAGRNETATPPEGAAYVQLGLRVYGSGTSKISAFLLDHVAQTPERIFGRSEYLLLTNHYPSDRDLYRNGFVHRRVLDYRRQGTRVDVFRHRRDEKLGHREFDGVDVISGGDDVLAALMRSNQYKAVLVHFLDPAMWQILRQEAPTVRPLLWLHGAEIQAWHRRGFNDISDIDREAAKQKSAKRDAFWRQVLQELPAAGKLIFVSRQFAEQTLGDLELAREHEQCTVIHNLIDGRLFEYRPKAPELRKRVLSIRPFASRKYANDLSVAAILELKHKPYFHELFFHFVGDGPLFDTIVAPLRGLPNVRLDKGFITQQEIAQLHREYGVFLCPTRDDTQGVSRDEAMASGLVPVTTRIAAVPEFVDEDCAILAEPESHLGLAAGIARLYEDPAAFAKLSKQAAERVRRQSGPEQTTARELALIFGRSS